MYVNSKRITQLLASPEERRDKKSVHLTSREALEFLLADWGFVESLTLKSRCPQKNVEESLHGLRDRLLQAGIPEKDESGKLIALITAAKEEGIAHLKVTITKQTALELRGSIHENIVPGGAKLCFATELSGHVSLGVTFLS